MDSRVSFVAGMLFVALLYVVFTTSRYHSVGVGLQVFVLGYFLYLQFAKTLSGDRPPIVRRMPGSPPGNT